MKKIFIGIVSLLIIGVSVATILNMTEPADTSKLKAELEGNKLYPFFNSLSEDDKEIYLQLCNAAEKFENAILGGYDSSSECDAAEESVKSIFTSVFYEQSQYFWVDPYNCGLKTTKSGDKYQLTVELDYIIDSKQAKQKQKIFDQKVSEIVEAAKQKSSTYEKVLFVYDTILKNTEYDNRLAEGKDFKNLGISAYGCLVEGKTICSGYTMAFELVMRELGYECGFEFNTYNDSINIFGNHVWNYCCLDGDYYYFDLTYDDTGFDNADFTDYLDFSHRYFAITKEELSKSQMLSDKAPTPECNGTQYNYYIYNGLNISQYDYNKVKSAIEKQMGSKFITLRFDDYSGLLRAQTELLNDGKIFKILGNSTNIKYSKSRSGYHLDFFVD